MEHEKQLRVLVAEDDEATRLILDRLLREQGFAVELASDGSEALAIATGPTPPPIMILDWVLPEVDGLDICRAVRAANAAPIYILMVTAKTEPDDLLQALDAGADDFLSKPFEPERLAARLLIASATLSETEIPSNEVLETLFEALEAGHGEVAVRDGSQVARVHIQNGQLSWVSLSSARDSILGFLEANAELGNEEARAVVEECRRSQRNTPDVLTDWGLIDAEKLRELLLSSIRQKLALVVRQSQAVALFLPSKPARPSQFTFSIEEVLPDIAAMLSKRQAETLERIKAPRGAEIGLQGLREILEPRMASWRGLECWSLLDVSSRQVVLGSSRCFGRDLVNAYTSLAHALSDSGQSVETLVSTEIFVDVVTTLPRHSRLRLLARFNARKVKVGLARQWVASLLSELSAL